MGSCCTIPVFISETDFEIPITLLDSESADLEIDVADYQIYPDEYEGSYNVVPKTTEQVLKTKGKMMAYDVTVEKIPDCYGLVTWNGSFLRVS